MTMRAFAILIVLIFSSCSRETLSGVVEYEFESPSIFENESAYRELDYGSSMYVRRLPDEVTWIDFKEMRGNRIVFYGKIASEKNVDAKAMVDIDQIVSVEAPALIPIKFLVENQERFHQTNVTVEGWTKIIGKRFRIVSKDVSPEADPSLQIASSIIVGEVLDVDADQHKMWMANPGVIVRLSGKYVGGLHFESPPRNGSIHPVTKISLTGERVRLPLENGRDPFREGAAENGATGLIR